MHESGGGARNGSLHRVSLPHTLPQLHSLENRSAHTATNFDICQKTALIII